MNLVLAIAIAALGGLTGERLGLPQGALLGSLLSVALVNATGLVEVPRLPSPLVFTMFVLIGLELGSQVTQKSVAALGDAWLPAVLFVGGLILLTVGASLVITRFFALDLATSMFGTAPGAISGIAAMGAAVGANVPVIVAIHTLRVTAIVFAMPWLHRLIAR